MKIKKIVKYILFVYSGNITPIMDKEDKEVCNINQFSRHQTINAFTTNNIRGA